MAARWRLDLGARVPPQIESRCRVIEEPHSPLSSTHQLSWLTARALLSPPREWVKESPQHFNSLYLHTHLSADLVWRWVYGIGCQQQRRHGFQPRRITANWAWIINGIINGWMAIRWIYQPVPYKLSINSYEWCVHSAAPLQQWWCRDKIRRGLARSTRTVTNETARRMMRWLMMIDNKWY